jgi:hypothetical protein
MAHGEKDRPIRQIARQQPKTVVAEIEHDAPFRKLRCQLCPGHDRHRATMRRL